MVVVVGFLAAVCRGLAQKARAETRQDLIKLSSARDAAAILSERGGLPAYAFMAPGAEKRAYPLGWLWWRVEHTADGTPRYAMGWALTYRRARRAAGLPLSIRAQHTEITLAPGHQSQNVD